MCNRQKISSHLKLALIFFWEIRGTHTQIIISFYIQILGDLQVILTNYALTQQKALKGIYKQYEECNGKMSWKSEIGAIWHGAFIHHAIWFVPKSNSWGIGPIDKIGTTDFGIAAIEDTGGDSPLDVPNDQWALHNGRHGWMIPKSGSIIIKHAPYEGMIKTLFSKNNIEKKRKIDIGFYANIPVCFSKNICSVDTFWLKFIL